MIAHLSGNILAKDEKSVIIDTNGVGYRVSLSQKKIATLKRSEISLFCHTNSKKDSWEICGFFSFDELRLFEFLIGISGIGVKTALEASAIGSIERLKDGIKDSDPVVMEELFSLGKKKAQSIIFEVSREIKSKPSKSLTKEDNEAIGALVKLGFEKRQAKELITALPSSISKTSDKIKEALKNR